MFRLILCTFYVAFCHGYILNTNDNQNSDKTTHNVKQANVSTFYNIIAQSGGGPWVIKHIDGWYYMTRTTGIDLRIWRSHLLTTIDADAGQIVWKPSGSGPACKAIWAPELHFIQSAWYIYFSATTCDGDNNNHRMFVLENTNPDPLQGSFIWKGKITDSTDKWAIDGTVFNHPPGGLHFVWSGWPGDVNIKQNLYIAEMSNPWTISSERVEIATPTYPWETNTNPTVNEGPEVTIRNNVISLVYSASGSWTNTYCLGLITALNTSDLMKASSWHKRPNPIFQSANDILAPGHHSLTISPDGKEDWIFYHSARYNGSGWDRQIRAQRFTWNADSTPNLGEPAPRNSPIPIPSGEPLRDRYEVEDGRFIDGPSAINDSTASNHMKVGYIGQTGSRVIVTIECTKSGTYMIVIRNGNGSAGKAAATHRLSINGEAEIDVDIVYSGWDMWGASMIRANLTQGRNTLTFRKGDNYAELDEIDVFPDS